MPMAPWNSIMMTISLPTMTMMKALAGAMRWEMATTRVMSMSMAMAMTRSST